MRSAALLILFVLLGTVADADSFRERLNAANALLRAGNVEEAVNAYRELQIEEPESPELYYNLGCARFQQELKERPQTQDAAQAEPIQPFAEARASFEKAMTLGSGAVRRNAAFNRANCLAQAAKNIPQEQGQEQLLAAYRDSISAYEEVLRQFPDHEDARQNLDHMRYLLKKMLQKPPPPQEQQQGGGENQPQEEQQQENQEQSQSKSEQQEGQPQEQQQEESASQPQQQEDQQNSAQQQPEQKTGDEEQKQSQPEEQESPASPEEEQNPQKEQEPQSAADAQKAPDRQTVEALLQSLEDRDELERKLERRQQREPQLKGEWW
ncbi:MAG: tetratricopeptide repeat protein [Candidatus Hydrogenedentes bacterium]|nr:tetratricopeptide repeat protein [Candidatus Hydrogenedentota bacterium]